MGWVAKATTVAAAGVIIVAVAESQREADPNGPRPAIQVPVSRIPILIPGEYATSVVATAPAP
jgi:hypothetical protein